MMKLITVELEQLIKARIRCFKVGTKDNHARITELEWVLSKSGCDLDLGEVSVVVPNEQIIEIDEDGIVRVKA